MNTCAKLKKSLFVLVALVIAACSGGGGGDGGGGRGSSNEQPPPSNQVPVANAGVDQRFILGTGTVQLNGAASTDPDGTALTFAWEITLAPQGSTATLNNPNSNRPSFAPDRAGVYVVQLTVSDGQESATDEVQVDVAINVSPLANAGPDQDVSFGATVMPRPRPAGEGRGGPRGPGGGPADEGVASQLIGGTAIMSTVSSTAGIGQIEGYLGSDARNLLDYTCKGIPKSSLHVPGPR